MIIFPNPVTPILDSLFQGSSLPPKHNIGFLDDDGDFAAATAIRASIPFPAAEVVIYMLRHAPAPTVPPHGGSSGSQQFSGTFGPNLAESTYSFDHTNTNYDTGDSFQTTFSQTIRSTSTIPFEDFYGPGKITNNWTNSFSRYIRIVDPDGTREQISELFQGRFYTSAGVITMRGGRVDGDLGIDNYHLPRRALGHTPLNGEPVYDSPYAFSESPQGSSAYDLLFHRGNLYSTAHWLYQPYELGGTILTPEEEQVLYHEVAFYPIGAAGYSVPITGYLPWRTYFEAGGERFYPSRSAGDPVLLRSFLQARLPFHRETYGSAVQGPIPSGIEVDMFGSDASHVPPWW